MADRKKSVSNNIAGNFFVDTTCINCDACRKFAPSIFEDGGEYSYVKKQPQNEEEEISAIMALISCPTASIGMNKSPLMVKAKKGLPLEIYPDIFLNGYNSKKSYGADSYFIKDESGNWLIDSPRFSKDLVGFFENHGGIDYIFLSHIDDVADADKYAKHFKAKRIMHEIEAASDVEIKIKGEDDFFIGDKAHILFTPGHTEGHCVLNWDKKYLFTGDHFAWRRREQMFVSFRKACWYSWEIQIGSVQKLEKLKDVQVILPGHGRRGEFPKGAFSKIIQKAVRWMEENR